MPRRVFGIAVLTLGLASLVLHAQLVSQWRWTGMPVFIAVTAAAQIAGGLALQFDRWARQGSLVVAIVYIVFALTALPAIAMHPLIYATWGQVFYSLGVVTGAVALYTPTAWRASIVVFGVCNISYAIEQVEFLARTSSLVPVWIPFGGAFWAVLTTIAFAAAGVALIAGYRPRLVARLVALMLGIFIVTIWIPALILRPQHLGNWSEGLETFAIAASAWVLSSLRTSQG